MAISLGDEKNSDNEMEKLKIGEIDQSIIIKGRRVKKRTKKIDFIESDETESDEDNNFIRLQRNKKRTDRNVNKNNSNETSNHIFGLKNVFQNKLSAGKILSHWSDGAKLDLKLVESTSTIFNKIATSSYEKLFTNNTEVNVVDNWECDIDIENFIDNKTLVDNVTSVSNTNEVNEVSLEPIDVKPILTDTPESNVINEEVIIDGNKPETSDMTTDKIEITGRQIFDKNFGTNSSDIVTSFNSWFSDIRIATKIAASTTVTHAVSKLASNAQNILNTIANEQNELFEKSKNELEIMEVEKNETTKVTQKPNDNWDIDGDWDEDWKETPALIEVSQPNSLENCQQKVTKDLNTEELTGSTDWDDNWNFEEEIVLDQENLETNQKSFPSLTVPSNLEQNEWDLDWNEKELLTKKVDEQSESLISDSNLNCISNKECDSTVELNGEIELESTSTFQKVEESNFVSEIDVEISNAPIFGELHDLNINSDSMNTEYSKTDLTIDSISNTLREDKTDDWSLDWGEDLQLSNLIENAQIVDNDYNLNQNVSIEKLVLEPETTKLQEMLDHDKVSSLSSNINNVDNVESHFDSSLLDEKQITVLYKSSIKNDFIPESLTTNSVIENISHKADEQLIEELKPISSVAIMMPSFDDYDKNSFSSSANEKNFEIKFDKEKDKIESIEHTELDSMERCAIDESLVKQNTITRSLEEPVSLNDQKAFTTEDSDCLSSNFIQDAGSMEIIIINQQDDNLSSLEKPKIITMVQERKQFPNSIGWNDDRNDQDWSNKNLKPQMITSIQSEPNLIIDTLSTVDTDDHQKDIDQQKANINESNDDWNNEDWCDEPSEPRVVTPKQSEPIFATDKTTLSFDGTDNHQKEIDQQAANINESNDDWNNEDWSDEPFEPRGVTPIQPESNLTINALSSVVTDVHQKEIDQKEANINEPNDDWNNEGWSDEPIEPRVVTSIQPESNLTIDTLSSVDTDNHLKEMDQQDANINESNGDWNNEGWPDEPFEPCVVTPIQPESNLAIDTDDHLKEIDQQGTNINESNDDWCEEPFEPCVVTPTQPEPIFATDKTTVSSDDTDNHQKEIDQQEANINEPNDDWNNKDWSDEPFEPNVVTPIQPESNLTIDALSSVDTDDHQKEIDQQKANINESNDDWNNEDWCDEPSEPRVVTPIQSEPIFATDKSTSVDTEEHLKEISQQKTISNEWNDDWNDEDWSNKTSKLHEVTSIQSEPNLTTDKSTLSSVDTDNQLMIQQETNINKPNNDWTDEDWSNESFKQSKFKEKDTSTDIISQPKKVSNKISVNDDKLTLITDYKSNVSLQSKIVSNISKEIKNAKPKSYDNQSSSLRLKAKPNKEKENKPKFKLVDDVGQTTSNSTKSNKQNDWSNDWTNDWEDSVTFPSQERRNSNFTNISIDSDWSADWEEMPTKNKSQANLSRNSSTVFVNRSNLKPKNQSSNLEVSNSKLSSTFVEHKNQNEHVASKPSAQYDRDSSWFSELKSATKNAAVTTMTHAVNRWSFHPGNILDSVVDNISSAVGIPSAEDIATVMRNQQKQKNKK